MCAISGSNGSTLYQLAGPRDVTVDPSTGIIYVADTGNHRIMNYTFGLLNGTIIAGGNGPGTLNNQLYSPYCIYFESASNSLLIANYDASTVVRWFIGASGWTLVAGYVGYSGSSVFSFSSPSGVTIDSMGNIYVVDTYNQRIQLFLAGQRNGTTIAGVTQMAGDSTSLFNAPRSVALDSNLNLYVSDTNNHRVQMFQRY